MAEIFGAVAGGAGLVSLALQLADCAVKLKSFCEQVDKAPKAIRRISRELSTLSLLLRQIDGLRVEYGSQDADALADCIELCREGTEDIIEATTALDAILVRFRVAGRLYAAMKLNDVKELCTDLERSKNSLMLAFQVFNHRTQVKIMDASRDVAMQTSLAVLKHGEAIAQIHSGTALLLQRRQLPQNVLEYQPDLAQHRDDGPSDSHVTGRTLIRSSSKGVLTHSRTSFRFRLPVWFTDRVWLLSTSHSRGSWTMRIQDFRIRPRDIPMVAFLERGNIEMVRRMFDEGKAMPYDVYKGSDDSRATYTTTLTVYCSVLYIEQPMLICGSWRLAPGPSNYVSSS